MLCFERAFEYALNYFVCAHITCRGYVKDHFPAKKCSLNRADPKTRPLMEHQSANHLLLLRHNKFGADQEACAFFDKSFSFGTVIGRE